MKPSAMMPIEHNQAQMWRLSSDRRSVRMELPGLPVDGLPEPIRVKMDFGAGIIDQMIERFLILPAPPSPGKRN